MALGAEMVEEEEEEEGVEEEEEGVAAAAPKDSIERGESQPPPAPLPP
jgi:hypothetical protein